MQCSFAGRGTHPGCAMTYGLWYTALTCRPVRSGGDGRVVRVQGEPFLVALGETQGAVLPHSPAADTLRGAAEDRVLSRARGQGLLSSGPCAEAAGSQVGDQPGSSRSPAGQQAGQQAGTSGSSPPEEESDAGSSSSGS